MFDLFWRSKARLWAIARDLGFDLRTSWQPHAHRRDFSLQVAKGKQRKTMKGFSKSSFSNLAFDFLRIWICGRFGATRRSICTCLEPFGSNFVANWVPPRPSWARPGGAKRPLWHQLGAKRLSESKFLIRVAPF